MSPKPNIFVLTQVDGWLEGFAEGPPHEAVGAIRTHQQIARRQFIQIRDVGVETQIDAKLLASLLKKVQKGEPGETGKVVPSNGDPLISVNDIDIVPSLASAIDGVE